MRRLSFYSSPLSALLLLVLTATAVMLVSALAWAGSSSWEVGVQAGTSFNDDNESFEQFDVTADCGLPWRWQWGSAVRVDTRLTTALGILEGGGDSGWVASAGFGFVFGSAPGRCPFDLRAGSALTVLSRDEFGRDDFGGPVQLTHHLGLYYRFLEHLSAAVRVQHMSNGGLYSENPGLNLVMLAMVYRF